MPSLSGKHLPLLLACGLMLATSACSTDPAPLSHPAARPAAGEWLRKLDSPLRGLVAPPATAPALAPELPALDAQGRVQVLLRLARPLQAGDSEALREAGFAEEVASPDRSQLQGRIVVARLPALAALEFVRWIAAVQPALHK